MRIIDMVNGKFGYAALPPPPAQGNQQPGTAFDMLLNEAGRHNDSGPAVERPERSRDDGPRSRTRTDEARRDDRPRRRENVVADDTTSTNGAAAVQESPQNAAQAVNENTEAAVIDEAQVIEKVAEILQVPAEIVKEWLTELGLTAPDLTDPAVVSKLLQLALDTENPAELLVNPEFPELYKAVNEAVAVLAADAKTTPMVSTGTQAVTNAEGETDVLGLSSQAIEITDETGNLNTPESKTNSDNPTNTMNRQSAAANADTAQTTAQASTGELNPEITDATLLKADDVPIDTSQAANPALNIETAVAKATQAVQQAAPQQPVNPADIIEQIMNQVKLTNMGGNFTEMRMTLRPESLGDIVLRVITQNGIVMAQFEAESQRVKEALESNFNLLRDALDEQGIKFSELSVFVRQDESERMSQFERARQSSRYRAESIGEATETAEAEQEISYHNGVIDVTA